MLLILLKKTDFSTKVTEIEGKIHDVSSLATKSVLTIVENKKYLMLVVWLIKQILIPKLLK